LAAASLKSKSEHIQRAHPGRSEMTMNACPTGKSLRRARIASFAIVQPRRKKYFSFVFSESDV
jgi:hypothetical protein